MVIYTKDLVSHPAALHQQIFVENYRKCKNELDPVSVHSQGSVKKIESNLNI